MSGSATDWPQKKNVNKAIVAAIMTWNGHHIFRFAVISGVATGTFATELIIPRAQGFNLCAAYYSVIRGIQILGSVHSANNNIPRTEVTWRLTFFQRSLDY
jgi:hypothetical protein